MHSVGCTPIRGSEPEAGLKVASRLCGRTWPWVLGRGGRFQSPTALSPVRARLPIRSLSRRLFLAPMSCNRGRFNLVFPRALAFCLKTIDCRPRRGSLAVGSSPGTAPALRLLRRPGLSRPGCSPSLGCRPIPRRRFPNPGPPAARSLKESSRHRLSCA